MSTLTVNEDGVTFSDGAVLRFYLGEEIKISVLKNGRERRFRSKYRNAIFSNRNARILLSINRPSLDHYDRNVVILNKPITMNDILEAIINFSHEEISKFCIGLMEYKIKNYKLWIRYPNGPDDYDFDSSHEEDEYDNHLNVCDDIGAIELFEDLINSESRICKIDLHKPSYYAGFIKHKDSEYIIYWRA